MSMRLQRSQTRRKAAAPADETEESSDTTSAEATSEDDDDSAQNQRLQVDVGRKNAARKSTGLYAQVSVEDSDAKSSSEEDETEYQVQDNNDEYCSTCGTKKDSDKLLCCELCPAVYHLYCLKPPLKSIPAGDWFCTHCRSILGLEHVEKFLAARTRMVDLEAERVAEEKAAQQRVEAAQAKKRKTASSTIHLASKKRKTASVQQLHTVEPAPGPAKTEQQSMPINQSLADQSKADGAPVQANSQCKPQDGAEAEAQGLKSHGLASGSNHPSPQHANCGEPQLQTGANEAAASALRSELHLDASAQRSHESFSAKAAGTLTTVKEYYVKWKGKSYLHCSWVRHDDVLKVARLSAGLNMRFRNYQRSVYGMPQEASSGKLEDQEVGDLVNGIDPSWVLVDRIIALQEKQGSGMQYLVKWRGLGYEECTWEALSDLLPKFNEQIARFKSQQPIANELVEKQKSRAQANKSQAETTRSAAGRKIGTRKFSDSPSFLHGGGSLHPYQLEGLNWLYFAWEQRKHVILADEMGLGKTIQSIAFLAALKEEEQVQRPHLVVVPLSTFPNWEREFALWAPQLNVVPFIGNQAGRNVVKQHELYADPNLVKGKAKTHSKHAELQARVKFHVLLTTYEMVGFEAGTLRSLEYETLIVDEGHRLKNQQSKLFQQLHNFKTRQRTLLTGTPLQNNLSELWMLLHFLDAGKFQSLEEFQADFSDFSHGDQIGKLHELLSPHLLRRLKKDVLKQLPPKKEQIVRVELSPLQKDWYRGILTKNFPNLSNGKQTGRLKSVMMELRKCCNHPFLIDEQEWPTTRDPDQFVQQLVQASGKLALVDSMLARMKDRGHRVLIYSQFTTLLDLLEDWLTARKWGYQRIDGSVAGPERQSRIDQFNKRPADNFVFLLSTKAGGLGINLASADTVIIYDSDWNPHNDLQAQARAHRLGQLKPVMIYRLVTRLTIEERMMQQTKKKMVLEHLVVHKMNTAADLKQDELDDILRYGAAELFADAAAANQQAQQVGLGTVKGGGEDNEADAAGGPANKAAAEKADKLIRLSEREQAEGRTGGQAGQRIVYDDAAIERLLDRSQLTNADAEQADEKEDDFVKGFKVANFEIIESPDQGEKAAEEEAVLEAQPSVPVQAGAAFWEELLKAGYQDLQQAQMEVLGKGKRERRQVNYDEKSGKGRDDASDYSAHSDESGEESGEEDTPASKKRKSEGLVLSEAEATAVQPVAQQRQATFGSSGTPLTWGFSHQNFRILGFTNTQRALFMKVLMQFGLGQQTKEGKFDWSHIHRHMAGRWAALTPDQTTSYAELVMAQLSEPATDKPFFTDGISKKDILQHYELNKVLDRLGTLHLVRHALTQQMPQPDLAFNLGPAHAPMSRHLKVWQPQHDKKLMYGVLKHGWEQWLMILKDPLLGVEPILRQELFLLPLQPAAASNEASAAFPKLQMQTIPPGAISPAPRVARTTAAAGCAGFGSAVDVAAGPSDKPASIAGPESSSAPSTIATKPDNSKAEMPASAAAVAGNANSQVSQSIKPEPVPTAQPAAADASVVDAQGKLLQGGLDVELEIKPALADPPAATSESTSAMFGLSTSAEKSCTIKLEPAAANAADKKSRQSVEAGVRKPGEGTSATLVPQTNATMLPPPAVSQVFDLTTAEAPRASTAGAGTGPAAACTDATATALAADAAATSTVEQPRPAEAVPRGAAVIPAKHSRAPVVLGCPKCRWAPKGCSSCRAKWQAAGHALPEALAASGSTGADAATGAKAAAAANAAAAARAERSTTTKLCNWLANRTAVLASILKGIHKVGPATAASSQAQSRRTITAPGPRLVAQSARPIIITQQTSASCPPGASVVTSATALVGTPVSTGQWQQNAVQLSQFRHQQRQLQQQQLAAAQEKQRQNLLLQQQQRQRHTSLLRQQHQTAQLQQQQQQAAKAQAAQAQALQQQQLRMRQQQQQHGLRQQQVNQQHQLQLQLQLHQQQQQQQQLSSQQQVQRALTSQGLQQGMRLQPAAAAVNAAQHAQQPASSQAQINHPLSQPDKAGAPLLMSLHKQQAARASSPLVSSSSSIPSSPFLSHQQSNQTHGQSRQHPLPPFDLLQRQRQSTSYPHSQQLPQQQSLYQPGPLQQQPAHAANQSQPATSSSGQTSHQTVPSPLDPKFQALPEAERVKLLHQWLLAEKPNLQLLEVPQTQPHTLPQSLQEKKELIAVYNELCSTLLDVQVTLSQNKPQSMTAQDRNAAAACFQNSMQEMYGQCEEMVKTLVSGQARSVTQMQMQLGSKPQLQPVLRHHSGKNSARLHSPLAQPHASAPPRQGHAVQPSSPASPCANTASGLHGSSASASAPRACAGTASPLVKAASGSPGLTKASSDVTGTARQYTLPGDAKGSAVAEVPSSAQPCCGSLTSWAFGNSSDGSGLAAGRHSTAGMQTSQLPVSASRVGLPPVQSAGMSTQQPSNIASSQAYEQAKHFAAKPDSGTQASVSVGLGVLKAGSPGPQDLESIDLTAESDDHSI